MAADGGESGAMVDELLIALACGAAALKLTSMLMDSVGSGEVEGGENDSEQAATGDDGGSTDGVGNDDGGSLRWQFLAVFLPLKFADWVMGPYMYDLLAGKGYSAGQSLGSRHLPFEGLRCPLFSRILTHTRELFLSPLCMSLTRMLVVS
jgi:hypothetical protein